MKKQNKDRFQIGVMGSAGNICTRKGYKCAYEVGKEIAKAGHILVTGGGHGVMEGASKGAHDFGGLVVGILPGSAKEEANKFCDVIIPTGIGFARNLMNIQSSHGIIIVEGGVGTLTEAAYAYTNQTPAVAFVGSGGTADKLAGKTMDVRELETIVAGFNAKDCVEKIVRLIRHHKVKLIKYTVDMKNNYKSD